MYLNLFEVIVLMKTMLKISVFNSHISVSTSCANLIEIFDFF